MEPVYEEVEGCDLVVDLELVLRRGLIGGDGVLGRIGVAGASGRQAKALSEAAQGVQASVSRLHSGGWASVVEGAEGCWIMLVPCKVCEVTASQDKTVLWVNAPDGSCIGRFSSKGHVDVHRTVEAQRSGEGECLDCSHGGEPKEQWRRFRDSMKQHYGLDVSEDLIEV